MSRLGIIVCFCLIWFPAVAIVEVIKPDPVWALAIGWCAALTFDWLTD